MVTMIIFILSYVHHSGVKKTLLYTPQGSDGDRIQLPNIFKES